MTVAEKSIATPHSNGYNADSRCRLRNYNPTLMRWMEPDPTGAEYVDGLNLLQMERSNPVRYRDPTGMSSEGGSDVVSGDPGSLVFDTRFYKPTDIYVYYVIIKGSLMWDEPAGEHASIYAFGDWYGYYAASHVGHGAGSSDDVSATLGVTTGYVIPEDYSLYESDPSKVASGAIYVHVKRVYVRQCPDGIDPGAFATGVDKWVRGMAAKYGPGTSGGNYNALFKNCYDFVNDALDAGVAFATPSTAKTEKDAFREMAKNITSPVSSYPKVVLVDANPPAKPVATTQPAPPRPGKP